MPHRHVTENVSTFKEKLDTASRVPGISTTVCRVGHIADPFLSQKGVWNKREWLPSIIASSKYLGPLGPLDVVDWVPVDNMARILVEVLTASYATSESSGCGLVNGNSSGLEGTTVYHVVNQYPVPMGATSSKP